MKSTLIHFAAASALRGPWFWGLGFRVMKSSFYVPSLVTSKLRNLPLVAE